MKFDPSAITGVAFDLDGTLFDSSSVSREALIQGFKAFWKELKEDGPIPDWEEAKVHIGLASYEFFPLALPESHKHQWRLLHKHIGLCEHEHLIRGRGLTFDGVHNTLSLPKSKGYFLGCLSNASKIYFDSVLDGCKLREYFSKLVYLGENIRLGKSQFLEDWAQELGGLEKLIYVGDRGADVDAAHIGGIKVVAVTYGYGQREELKAADASIDRMEDLIKLVTGEGESKS